MSDLLCSPQSSSWQPCRLFSVALDHQLPDVFSLQAIMFRQAKIALDRRDPVRAVIGYRPYIRRTIGRRQPVGG